MGPIEFMILGRYVGALIFLIILIIFSWVIYGRIAEKAGYSKLWSILMVFIPFNLLLIWIFAFIDWPFLPAKKNPKNYIEYLRGRKKEPQHKNIFAAYKKAKSIFDEPIHIEDFSSEFNLTIEQTNELVSKGEVKAYQYRNELFIEKSTYKQT